MWTYWVKIVGLKVLKIAYLLEDIAEIGGAIFRVFSQQSEPFFGLIYSVDWPFGVLLRVLVAKQLDSRTFHIQ